MAAYIHLAPNDEGLNRPDNGSVDALHWHLSQFKA